MEQQICVICHLENTNTPFASIEEGCFKCKCIVHAACMTKWLVSDIGNGRCAHCRAQIRPSIVHTQINHDEAYVPDFDFDSDDDDDSDWVQYGDTSWVEPFGYIDVNLDDSSARATVTSLDSDSDINVVIIKDEDLEQHILNMDSIAFISNSVTVVIDDEYQYVDNMNIPPGWMMRVYKDGHNTRSFIKINTVMVAEL